MCCSKDEVEEERSGASGDISVYGLTCSITVPLERGMHVTGNLE